MKQGYLIMILLVTLLSCENGGGAPVEEKRVQDPVSKVKSEDDAMNEAIRKARETYPEFLKAFLLADDHTSDFNVKCKFAYPESFEHMWLNGLHYSGKQLVGILNSDPENVPRLKTGDRVEIHTDSVSDWMYVRDGKLVGGYTMRLLYERMDPAERERRLKELPFTMD